MVVVKKQITIIALGLSLSPRDEPPSLAYLWPSLSVVRDTTTATAASTAILIPSAFQLIKIFVCFWAAFSSFQVNENELWCRATCCSAQLHSFRFALTWSALFPSPFPRTSCRFLSFVPSLFVCRVLEMKRNRQQNEISRVELACTWWSPPKNRAVTVLSV